jgi:predicted O-linked N-acetylglucosamine transferase (SPINDLY family)
VLRRLVARALIALGARAERAGNLAKATARYRAATRVAPREASPFLNLGAVLEAQGDAEGAQRAYAVHPGNPYAVFNLGRLHFARGEHEAAEQALRRSLAGKPDFTEALIALANVLEARGDAAGALQALAQALRLEPLHAGAWYNYGSLLWQAERYDAAEDALRRTLELEPRFIPAHHLLSTLLRGQARLAEALEVLEGARRLEPARFDLESMEILLLTLGDTLTAQALFARQRAFGERLEAAFPARRAPYAQPAEPARRLRVGYVSCDFNRHPVAWFLLPLLERHDRASVETFCYSTGVKPPDPVTAQLRAAAQHWREVAQIDDAAFAEQVRRDAIDVLVDLTGHAGAMRLGVFAQQPAPVQLSWLGYLGSTGLTRITHRLTDARADPPGSADALHTEALLRLPHSQWCYRPVHEEPHAAEPPCRRNGFVTFGSFNHAPKLAEASLRCWAGILRGMPAARLHLVGVPAGRAQARLAERFAALGVDAARLTMHPRLPFGDFLRELDAVDIALDSLPYGGGTTTFDALWMGLPVLACTGERSVERSAASILGALGLEAWIAPSHEDYVRLALAHAADADGIARLRATLRARLRASPLMDEAGFARDVESAYRALWRDGCERRLA